MFRCPAEPVRKGVPGPEGYTDTIAGRRERHARAAAGAGLRRTCGRHPLLAKRRSLSYAILSPDSARARNSRVEAEAGVHGLHPTRVAVRAARWSRAVTARTAGGSRSPRTGRPRPRKLEAPSVSCEETDQEDQRDEPCRPEGGECASGEDR